MSRDLHTMEVHAGSAPGRQRVHIRRPSEFRRPKPGYLVAKEETGVPRTGFGAFLVRVQRFLIGRPIATEHEEQERVSKVKGLAILASDNISSSAYATEEIMRVLVLAGVGALALTRPISIAIAAVLAIVVISYLQVIRAYPAGGGSYAVAQDNLGAFAGLVAGAALLTDYILTVAVSTSAGVAAITSAYPALFEQRVLIAVGVIAVMTVLNLRGVRESGTVFALPTYLYVVLVLGVLGIGFFRVITGNLPPNSPPPEWLATEQAEPLTLLLILRAFASGSVALTGTEAVSNGVTIFKPPQVRNAQIVLVAMGTLFGTIFLGLSFLAGQIGIVPDPREVETVLSQITRTLVGTGPYYYFVQYATALLLVLAANTAFNGFPLLASIMARDGYLPRQFQFRGDRLALTTGIISLAIIAMGLVIVYRGSVTGLIPLYTVGVFLAFTVSQAGLVRRWFRARHRDRGWWWRLGVNGLGALATGVVLIEVAISKFLLGAWLVILIIPLLIGLFWLIHQHYRSVADQLAMPTLDMPLPEVPEPVVLVPVSKLDRAALRALAFARSISRDVTAIHVTSDPEEGEALRKRWDRWEGDVPLVILESPYRSLLGPLTAYIEALNKEDPFRPVTVVLSEFVPRHWWENFLHNQTALRLKLRLFFMPNTVVVDLPYHLGTYDELLDPWLPEGGAHRLEIAQKKK